MKHTVLGVDQAGPYIVGEFDSLDAAEEWIARSDHPEDYEIKPTEEVGFIW